SATQGTHCSGNCWKRYLEYPLQIFSLCEGPKPAPTDGLPCCERSKLSASTRPSMTASCPLSSATCPCRFPMIPSRANRSIIRWTARRRSYRVLLLRPLQRIRLSTSAISSVLRSEFDQSHD